MGHATCRVSAAGDRSAAEWRARMHANVLPALAAFKPDIIFISAGFDAHYKVCAGVAPSCARATLHSMRGDGGAAGHAQLWVRGPARERLRVDHAAAREGGEHARERPDRVGARGRVPRPREQWLLPPGGAGLMVHGGPRRVASSPRSGAPWRHTCARSRRRLQTGSCSRLERARARVVCACMCACLECCAVLCCCVCIYI